MRTRCWSSSRPSPTCGVCGDAGAFLALHRSRPDEEYTFRCACAAGATHPALGIPQWVDWDGWRYRPVTPSELVAPGLMAIKLQMRAPAYAGGGLQAPEIGRHGPKAAG